MSNQALPRTLLEAITYFSDPTNCFHFMVARRWPTGEITCPTCGGGHLRFDRKRMVWHCNEKHPRRQFSLKVGTIFEDSPIGLDKWLPTVWMIANMKNGVSSHEIARSLGVTQKTAWFMLHRVRLAMQDETGGKLSDEQAFRFNERKDSDATRFRIVLDHIVGRRLTYRELIGDKAVSNN